MRGTFRQFCSFYPKLSRIPVGFQYIQKTGKIILENELLPGLTTSSDQSFHLVSWACCNQLYWCDYCSFGFTIIPNGSRLGWFTITPNKPFQCCFITEIDFDNWKSIPQQLTLCWFSISLSSFLSSVQFCQHFVIIPYLKWNKLGSHVTSVRRRGDPMLIISGLCSSHGYGPEGFLYCWDFGPRGKTARWINLNGLASLSEERGRSKEGNGAGDGGARVLARLLSELDNSG